MTYQTSFPGIFAGGDLFTGPSIAVEAVAAGQQAAISIEKYLLDEELTENRPGKPTGTNWKGIPKNIVRGPAPRCRSCRWHSASPITSEVELGFTEEQARAETARCVDLRQLLRVQALCP